MAVRDVEVSAQQGTGIRGAIVVLVVGEERLHVIDERLHQAYHQLFAGGEVVVQRWFRQTEVLRDLSEAGVLHTLFREQLQRRGLDAFAGSAGSRAGHGLHPSALTTGR